MRRAETSEARMFVEVPMSVSIPPSIAAYDTGISSFEGGDTRLLGDRIHHRDHDGDDRCVVDESGSPAGEGEYGEQLLQRVVTEAVNERLADDVDQPGTADALAQDEHREDGDRRGTGEPFDADRGVDLRPGLENYQEEHDTDGSDVDRHRLGNEENEREADDSENEQDFGSEGWDLSRNLQQYRESHSREQTSDSGKNPSAFITSVSLLYRRVLAEMTSEIHGFSHALTK